MVDDSQPGQEILLVTGVSGGGKSTALQVLEDLGWETIDNFPIRLLKRLVGGSEDNARLAIGVDSRTRGFAPAEIIALFKKLEQREDISVTTMFVDCGSGELERRYNETADRTRWHAGGQQWMGSRPNANCSNRCVAGPTC